MNTIEQAAYIEVSAEVRYWEDASVNGAEDSLGSMIPKRTGANWEPVIRLADGQIMEWPVGVEANVHYKICDQGEYWLQDQNHQRVAKWLGSYVPNKFLCHGDEGFGDYIIIIIGADGVIKGWRSPVVNPEQWAKLEAMV